MIRINKLRKATLERDRLVRDCLASEAERQGITLDGLIDLQVRIVDLEHYLAHNEPTEASNEEWLQNYRDEHKLLYGDLKGHYGSDFDKYYGEALAEHNAAARKTLDESEGQGRAYVLPKFKADGSHLKLRKKDVPWSLYPR